MTDNPEAQPITPEDSASAARDIVAKLVASWREEGLSADALAEALLDKGMEQITSERGSAAAVSVIRELIRRIEKQEAERARQAVQEAMPDDSPTFP